MKTIIFKIPGHTVETDRDGNETNMETLAEVSMPYSKENLALAKASAFGEVEVAEDGTPEPEAAPSEEDVTLNLLADHEYRLCMLELGGETV